MRNYIFLTLFLTTICQAMPFSWLEITNQIPIPFITVQEDSNIAGNLFALGNDGNLYRSDDWGNSWHKKTPPTDHGILLFTQMAVLENTWYAITFTTDPNSGQVWRSSDNGDSWNLTSTIDDLPLRFEASKHVPDLLLLVTENGFNANQQKVLRSATGGENWQIVFQDESLDFPIIWHPTSAWKVYIGKIFSTDFGETWTTGNSKIVQGSDQNLPPGLYAAETSGLFVTRDDLKSWWPLLTENLNFYDSSVWSEETFVTGLISNSKFKLFFSDDSGDHIYPWMENLPMNIINVSNVSDWLIYGCANGKTYLYDESPADLDGSKRVDGGDLVILSISFGADTDSDLYNPDADLNNDGIVDGEDLTILSSLWGKNFEYDDTQPPGDFPSE